MKRCSKCGIEKDEKLFNKNKSRGDGLNCYCRNCEKEYYKTYVAANYRKVNAQREKWRDDNAPKMRSYRKAWEKRNPDAIKKRRAKTLAENPDVYKMLSEKSNAKGKEWQKKSNLKKTKDQISKLGNGYVRQQLKKRGFSNITSEIIETKKLILKIKRYGKDKSKAT